MSNINFYQNSKHISEYRGVMVQQRPAAFPLIHSLALEESVDQIIEIGTFHGGLSLFLADNKMYDVHTFDIINHNPSLPTSERLNRYFYDSFSNECKSYITNLTKNKKTLWLFDGGNKAKEVNFYCDIIKEGEVAMAHDFAPDEQSFNYLKNNDIWLWHEINDSAFNPVYFDKHQSFEDIWKNTVWGCYRRKNK